MRESPAHQAVPLAKARLETLDGSAWSDWWRRAEPVMGESKGGGAAGIEYPAGIDKRPAPHRSRHAVQSDLPEVWPRRHHEQHVSIVAGREGIRYGRHAAAVSSNIWSSSESVTT